MKKYLNKKENGFIVPALSVIIAVLLIGGGIYIYQNDKPKKVIALPSANPVITKEINKPVPVALPDTTHTTTTPSTTPTTKTISKTPSVTSQNSKDIPQAKINLETIQKRYGSDKKVMSITAPASNILEPGKLVTVLFSSIKDADKYEILFTYPDYNSSNQKIVLSKQFTTSTQTDILVPNTRAIAVSENFYNGEELVVKAYAKDGKVITEGKVQIKILPPANQPTLAKANKYVFGKEGGEATITFGKLAANLKTRKFYVDCINSYTVASIDGISCGEQITLGAGEYTKKIVIKPNIFTDRETAFSITVQYFDSSGMEPNPDGFDDESFLSFKIGR